MKKRETVTLLIGLTWAVIGLLALGMIVMGRTAATVSGVVVICLSLASGMLLPNPISFFGLIAGILLLVLNPTATGIILLLFSLGGMLSNLIVYLKSEKNST